MLAGPRREPTDGSTAADALTGRAWLAQLPNELAAQRRVMARLAARASVTVLTTTASEAAARRHPADLPGAMASYVTRALSREP
jgi:hypothetical protein